MKAVLPAPLRLLSFWLGLPVFLFLLWAWRDSMHHPAAAHWPHGAARLMKWPPVEKPPVLPSFTELDAGLPTFKAPDFNPPAVWETRPSQPPFHSRIGYERPTNSDTTMQPHRSIGSKAGALWISSWIAPKFPPQPQWDYRAETQDGSWFPPLERTTTAITRNTTAWIPYWLLTGLYALAWAALLFWRGRRRRKLLAGVALPVPPDGTGVVPQTAHHP
ncbi:hypothetical protein [Luteolibacter sp. Populi]|uniref:hypothetical protein n=1 Tax=Luteolibacter sp. Populi TaxID=3230487 RepID=UPI0034658BDC